MWTIDGWYEQARAAAAANPAHHRAKVDHLFGVYAHAFPGMSREEIGSYLGLKLETVSRTFSKFQANGLLFVRHRQIRVTDPVGLQQLLEGVDI